MKQYISGATAIACFLLLVGRANAASFDCAKARTAHEMHICYTPALNLADTRLGEAYQAAVRSFPLRGFVLATQRVFLLGYAFCDEQNGDPCIYMLNKRISDLRAMENASVYSDQNPARSYNENSGVFWITLSDGQLMLNYFGGWMPDAYNPEPFPDGFICNDSAELLKSSSGYALRDQDRDTIVITDQKITAQISCSARNGLNGEFRRIR